MSDAINDARFEVEQAITARLKLDLPTDILWVVADELIAQSGSLAAFVGKFCEMSNTSLRRIFNKTSQLIFDQYFSQVPLVIHGRIEFDKPLRERFVEAERLAEAELAITEQMIKQFPKTSIPQMIKELEGQDLWHRDVYSDDSPRFILQQFLIYARLLLLLQSERQCIPCHIKEVSATAAEETLFRQHVQVVKIPGKNGMGVRTRIDVPASTLVGVLAGKVRRSEDFEARLSLGQTSNTFAMEAPDKKDPRKLWVVDPELGLSVIAPRFEASVAHRIDEPSPTQKHINCTWLHNLTFDKSSIPRIELYTNKHVPAGRELLAHYSTEYHNTKRCYKGPKTNQPQPQRTRIIFRKGKVQWEDANAEWEGSQMSEVSDVYLSSHLSAKHHAFKDNLTQAQDCR